MDKNGRKAFTLVELLVVISIISMLMSILLPALSNAREQGRSIVCRSNLKQLQLGWLLYADANRDQLCQNWCWAGNPSVSSPEYNTDLATKNGLLWPYVDDVRLYKCPSYKGWLNRHYFISGSMYGYGSKLCRNGLYIKMPEIDNSAQRAVFLEGAIHKDYYEISTPEVLKTYYVIDIEIYTIWHDEPSRPAIRHKECCNISFADGHVERYKFRDKRTVEYLAWRLSNVEASPNNKDLEQLIYWINAVKARKVDCP